MLKEFNKFSVGLVAFFLLVCCFPAAAGEVDISDMDTVDVSSWSDLKNETEKSDNAGKAVVLTQDDTATPDTPIESVGGSGMVIDGGGFTLTGQEGTTNGQFINFDSSAITDLTVQNIKISGFGHTENSGGAIYNAGKIGGIYADFSDNYVHSSSMGVGGAIYNTGTISELSGNFSGNFVQSDSSYAMGGAIYNTGSLSLVNSSFLGNYVQTSATQNSADGQMTMGGAIFSFADLTIKADNGESIFSGNTVKWAAGSDSSAITLLSYQNAVDLTLDSRNNGLIRFDDKIQAVNYVDYLLLSAKQQGFTIKDDGAGGYVIDDGSGKDIYIYKDNDSFLYQQVQENALSQDDVNQRVSQFEQQGCEISYDGDNVNVIDKQNNIYQFVKQEDGTFQLIQSVYLSSYGGNLIISGDSTGKVELNNEIIGMSSVDVSGTVVDVNEGVGTLSNSVIHNDGVLNINAGARSENAILAFGGTINVADQAEVYLTEVNNGSILHVAGGGYAENTTVNSGGQLQAEDQARLNNLQANDGAELDIDLGAYLTGNVVIHAGANMGGTYDYSQIFKDSVTDAGSLTLIGGFNDALTETSLVDTTGQKNLHLTNGNYVVGENAQAVSGWDMLTVQDTATVKLDGDIALSGPNKKIIVENGSTLDLSGNSPTNYIIQGSLSNDGSINFSHAGDDADDITTVYGNYTAYTNASMTIDVNPVDNTSDLLRVDGDVAGTTNVTLNIVGADVKPREMLQFVEAPNDDLSTGAYFEIFRVNNSAYNWNSLYQNGGWYTATDDIIPDGSASGYGTSDTGNLEDDVNLDADAVLPPDFPSVPSQPTSRQPSVVAEAIAYMGLPSIGIEQTRNMTRNITSQIASAKFFTQNCYGLSDCQYQTPFLSNLWVTPVYSYADVTAPVSYEANINGFEAGFDVLSDYYNRLGFFASYRSGVYEFDGEGVDYFSKVASETDISSYILGLYHRYDEGMVWTMSQIFLGYQNVDVSTDDGVSTDTTGIEFGASLEAGLIFNPTTNLTIEPILRVAYTQIYYDDMSDDYGKTASYGDVRNIEVEAGLKFERTYLHDYGYAKFYFKPSVIQNIGSGDVTITSLNQIEGLENSTLGRLEIGASINFLDQLNGYANAAYTFGSDYTNAAVNAGLSLAF